MQLEDQFDFIPPPYEQIRLKGTRIGIEHVIRYYNAGMTAELIAHSFAYPLPIAQIYAAITYYLFRKEYLDRYVLELDEEMDRLVKESIEKKKAIGLTVPNVAIADEKARVG